MKTTSILIVEDDSMSFESLKKILDNLGYQNLVHATNGMDALNAIKEKSFELVLMDIGLEGKLDGIDTSELMDGKARVIFTSGNHKDGATFSRIGKAKSYGFISKPFTSQLVKEAIENALK
ncbi:MAG: response regulator [bacterium]|nr:response regulator [bacterium]